MGLQLSPGNVAGDEETDEYLGINRTTGRIQHMEPQPTLPEMPDEEKEHEAERLFVLFDRFVLTLWFPFSLLIFGVGSRRLALSTRTPSPGL